MEASTCNLKSWILWIKKVFTSPKRKMRLMTLIKLVKLFVLWSESDPLLYRWCRLSNHIWKKTIPGIPIDVVAVNYAVFEISIYLIITCDVPVFYVKYSRKRENIWVK